jgi:type IV fimbrial biogenesis protein FimT
MNTGAMHPRANLSAGFTLVEMMIVIALVAIIMAIAVPSFREASLGSQLRATANELVAGAMLARSEAIKRNAAVTMCVSTSGTACTGGSWEQGWIVIQGGNVLQRQQAGATGFKVSSGVTTLDFQPIGAGATPATFTVCRATPTVGAQQRIVAITFTGRASVSTQTSTTCP